MLSVYLELGKGSLLCNAPPRLLFCAMLRFQKQMEETNGGGVGIQFGINTLGLLGGGQLFWDQFFEAVGRWVLI